MVARMARWSALPLALSLVSWTGCIPLPALAPPLKSSVGLGAAMGNPLPDNAGAPLSSSETILDGRFAVVPQSLFPEQHRRPIEAGAGYAFQIFANDNFDRRNRHGVFADVEALLGDWWLGEGWRGRLVVRGSAHYFVLQNAPGDGGGGMWAVGFEIARFAQTDGEQGGGFQFLGAASGELGVGLELFGGYFSVARGDYGVFGVALSVRTPGAAGLGLIPLTGTF